MSFIAKVGSTAELDPDSPDALLTVEPETGATLRTKGRLYALCEVRPVSPGGAALAREVVDLVRREYYYDLSAGIEISLRRAIRQANRRAAQHQGITRGRFGLHLICVVVVNNELHAARVGATQVFLVRRARLFLPGDDPGDLADFVHRTTTRRAASLGLEQDLLPAVWRQPIEAGDTIMMAGGALIDTLGADELKSAAITLHPQAAAEHVRNRAIAAGSGGSASAFFIEIAAAPAAATRVSSATEITHVSDEVVLAESIRQGVDGVVRRLPRLDRVPGRLARPIVGLLQRLFAVALELTPRRRPELPRSPDIARTRIGRQHRAAAALAAGIVLTGVVLSFTAYRDYERARAIGDYAAAFNAAQAEVAAARLAIERAPRDGKSAEERLGVAIRHLAAAASSPLADALRVGALSVEIDRLRDVLSDVFLDLGRIATGARPTQLAQTVNGLYAADPGSGRLWRVYGDPVTTSVVLERGLRTVGAPVAVLAQGEAVYALDDARRVWRAEGNGVAEVTPGDAGRWAGVTEVALFDGNLYVLDEKSGQVWKHEGSGERFGPAIAFLAQPLATGARSIAVDGGIWIVDRNGDLVQYRRNPAALTAQRVDLLLRWQSDAVRGTRIQAIEAQRSIYLLDAPGRRVVQLTRDGRETARIALPASLPEPNAFYVSETQRRVYSVHGGKLSLTDLK